MFVVAVVATTYSPVVAVSDSLGLRSPCPLPVCSSSFCVSLERSISPSFTAVVTGGVSATARTWSRHSGSSALLRSRLPACSGELHVRTAGHSIFSLTDTHHMRLRYCGLCLRFITFLLLPVCSELFLPSRLPFRITSRSLFRQLIYTLFTLGFYRSPPSLCHPWSTWLPLPSLHLVLLLPISRPTSTSLARFCTRCSSSPARRCVGPLALCTASVSHCPSLPFF